MGVVAGAPRAASTARSATGVRIAGSARSSAASGGEREISLYAARETIYQREVRGPWQDRRAILLFILAGFYVLLPWVTWQGRQAVLFDVPGRRFYLFALTFWPQDFIYLSGLLILGALSLFFFTNLAGRLWCGYACPQTVWTKFFMWMEWLTEGDRNQRIKLDREPWSPRKVARKAAKHSSWLAFSAVVGVTFVGYFLPIRELLPRIATFDVSGGEWIFLALASLLLYADAGFMREQICKYACPYARFQGAMFDRATLTIFYDGNRGEPRGRRLRDADPAAKKGDCIDCRLCVHVCPTGIDIRNGTQYECIGCAACIDACDSIMEEVGQPKGLVRYTTQSELEGRPMSIFRARTAGYGAVLLIAAGTLAYGLVTRMPVDLDVLHDRARLYREVSHSQIENVYTLKIMNKSQHTAAYRIAASEGFTFVGPSEVDVAAGELKSVPVQVRMERHDIRATSMPLTFQLSDTANAGVHVEREARFLAPPSAIGHREEDDEDKD